MIENLNKLIQIAIDNKKNSYSPYSKFRVSALVITKSGKIYKGVNIENASYSATICAERSALASCISDGHTDIEAMILTADAKDTSPCGVCRQFMAEFLDPSCKIVLANSVDDYKIYTMEELLPLSFKKDKLEEI
ncbi:MAG: cytidine deaminase [Peptoniphilaceae bacterium]|nr:cytidine deaminase [Peptoniphilaceae bacterium]MDY6018387.1 cytidine deaminase [Anaerococcus sp.]